MRRLTKYPVLSRLVIGLVVTLFSRAASQISSQNVERHFISNARAAALADAVVSDATDVNGMYWNPSLLAFMRDQSIVLNYSLERVRERDNIMNENLVVPIVPHESWGLGFGATFSHVGHVEPGSPLSGYHYEQVSVDVGVAYAIVKPLSFGIAGTVRHGRVRGSGVTVASSSVGVCYFPSPEVCYGVSYQGIGEGVEYLVDPLVGQTNIARMRLPKSLQLGVTMRLGALEETPVLTVTAANQKIFGTDGIIYKGGIELWPTDFLTLRTGYWVGTESVSARFGGGFRFGLLQIDYAVSTTELQPQFHQVSLSYLYDKFSPYR